MAFLLYDNEEQGKLSKAQLMAALAAKNSSGIFQGLTDDAVVECMVDDLFEEANVALDAQLSVEDILRAYKKDPSVLSLFV